jgi:hypothetical protein
MALASPIKMFLRSGTRTGGHLMRTSPVNVVDPTDMAGNERDNLSHIVEEIVESGTIKLDALPEPLRAQLLFALDACAKGQVVAAVANGKPLTSTEAAGLLGMSRTPPCPAVRRGPH